MRTNLQQAFHQCYGFYEICLPYMTFTSWKKFSSLLKKPLVFLASTKTRPRKFIAIICIISALLLMQLILMLSFCVSAVLLKCNSSNRWVYLCTLQRCIASIRKSVRRKTIHRNPAFYFTAFSSLDTTHCCKKKQSEDMGALIITPETAKYYFYPRFSQKW